MMTRQHNHVLSGKRAGQPALLLCALAAACLCVCAYILTVLVELPCAFAAEMDIAAATKAQVSTEGVEVSADEDAARTPQALFAVEGFERASAGSNRAIDDEYRGYTYYIGKKNDTLMYLVTDETVVVYVDEAAAEQAECSLGSPDDIAQLQSILVALDEVASHVNESIPAAATWYFTSSKENELNGVRYLFDQVYNDRAYNVIVGADGTDATNAGNPLYTRPLFACFAAFVSAEDVTIAPAPTQIEALGTFFSRLDWSPLVITLKTTLTAIVFIFVLGLACAYVCLHARPRVRDVLDTLFTIPMVLPPTVCGFLLLLLLGSNTALGRFFIDIGFPLIFSWPATVIAAVVVAFPLMYRNALGAFENLDANMLDAARTLGWSEARIFFKIMLPLSWSSIAAGTVLAFARALGEFGATLFLAGDYLGITRTVPIAIYFEWMTGNTGVALFWTLILVLFSFVVIAFINLWSRRTTRYRKGATEQ